MHQYMGVSHIDEIGRHDLPKALAYVHHLALQDLQPQKDNHDEHNAFWRKVGMLEYNRISSVKNCVIQFGKSLARTQQNP